MDMKRVVEADTAQEMFDFVARALLRQGGPAVGDDGVCAYRAPNGARCAVGHMIADEDYEPWMEGRSAWSLATLGKAGLGRYEPQAKLMDDLQRAHDNAVLSMNRTPWLPGWKGRMRDVAADHGLDAGVIDGTRP